MFRVFEQGEKGDMGGEGEQGVRGDPGIKGKEGPPGDPGLTGVRVSDSLASIRAFESSELADVLAYVLSGS